MIKDRSKSYDAYEQVATPSAGTTIPKGKDRDEKDTLTAKHTTETVKNAKEVKDAAKKALDLQLGRNTPSGGKLGDATQQPNSGVLDSCPNELDCN